MELHAGTIAYLDPAQDEELRIRSLVDESVRLNDSIEADVARLGELKELLLELPPGRYCGSNLTGRVLVVPSSTAIKPGEAQVAAARALAGKHAAKLFTREVSYKAVKGLRDIATALLTPAKARKLIALCEVPTAAQIRF